MLNKIKTRKTYEEVMQSLNSDKSLLVENKIITKSDSIQYKNNDEIILPDDINIIEFDAFNGFEKLKDVHLPKNLRIIKRKAFNNCLNLKKVIFPDTLKLIDFRSFAYCMNLKDVEFNNSLHEICEEAFLFCTNLSKIIIPKTVQIIKDKAFSNCYNLKEVILPDNIHFIPRGLFSSCAKLTDIHLPNNLDRILANAFECCLSLKYIELPASVNYIQESAFYNCQSLQKITLPENIKVIANNTFKSCSSLTDITLPKNLKEINNQAFSNCESLTSIVIPDNVNKLGKNCFENCYNLSSVKLPNSLYTLRANTFKNCFLLKDLYIPQSIQLVEDKAFENVNFNYLYINDDGSKFLTNNRLDDNKIYFDLTKIKKSYEIIPTLLSFESEISKKIYDICYEYNIKFSVEFLKDLQQQNLLEDFLNNANFKYYKNILKKIDKPLDTCDFEALQRLCYIIGIFENKNNEDNIDFAMNAYNFIKINLEQENLNIYTLSALFKDINIKKFNPELAKFITSKRNRNNTSVFDKLLCEEKNNKGFIVKLINYFDDIQKTHQSNKGSQRHLSPSVEHFKNFIYAKPFDGINEENKHIAETIRRFYYSQSTFDEACNIIKQFNELNVKRNILGIHLKNESGTIYDYDNQTKDKNFIRLSYDWLEKDDPVIFVLGKYCNCCSHIESRFGYGIMKASILDNNVQTLVIRDNFERIIAKSTLYINKNNGYGVLNNIEISYCVPNEDYIKIYQEIYTGVEDFTKLYNQLYPNNPIEKINVGQHHNDLNEILKSKCKEEENLLHSIDYRKYAKDILLERKGDSQTGQYIFWELNKYKIKESIQNL